MSYSFGLSYLFLSETSKRWEVKDGVWMVWWMKYQIFAPILLLQFLNLFWYFLISRRATVPGLKRFSARVGVGVESGRA